MKRRLINHGIAIIGIAILAFFSIASTATTPTSTPAPAPAAAPTGNVTLSNQGIFGEQINMPVKDFEAVGIVFAEAKYYNNFNTVSGNMFTYQALLKEAQRIRADAIINVVIDKRIERIYEGTSFNRQETWYGSALAIRYTTVLNQDEVFLNTARSYTTVNNNINTSSTEIGTVVLTNQGIFGEQILIPVKNFESAGLVFTEVQYEIDTFNSTITGDTFTYYALLREAQKVGAHAIINVVIDRQVERTNNIRQEKWYASALAIRYTTVVRRGDSESPSPINSGRSYTFGPGNTFGQ